MTPNLGSALALAHLAIGCDSTEAMRRTDEVLLKNHQEQMRRINEHYDRMQAILGGSPAKKGGKKWWNLKLF